MNEPCEVDGMFNHVRVSGQDSVSIVAESGERVTVPCAEFENILREGNTWVAVARRREGNPWRPPEPTPPMAPVPEEGALLAVAA